MFDRAGGDMSLRVEVMTMPAERQEVSGFVPAAFRNPLDVMQLALQDISAGRISALVR